MIDYARLLERVDQPSADGNRVRLVTRGGYDRSNRYSWIVDAARKIKLKQFVLDGEAVILGVDGASFLWRTRGEHLRRT